MSLKACRAFEHFGSVSPNTRGVLFLPTLFGGPTCSCAANYIERKVYERIQDRVKERVKEQVHQRIEDKVHERIKDIEKKLGRRVDDEVWERVRGRIEKKREHIEKEENLKARIVEEANMYKYFTDRFEKNCKWRAFLSHQECQYGFGLRTATDIIFLPHEVEIDGGPKITAFTIQAGDDIYKMGSLRCSHDRMPDKRHPLWVIVGNAIQKVKNFYKKWAVAIGWDPKIAIEEGSSCSHERMDCPAKRHKFREIMEKATQKLRSCRNRARWSLEDYCVAAQKKGELKKQMENVSNTIKDLKTSLEKEKATASKARRLQTALKEAQKANEEKKEVLEKTELIGERHWTRNTRRDFAAQAVEHALDFARAGLYELDCHKDEKKQAEEAKSVARANYKSFKELHKGSIEPSRKAKANADARAELYDFTSTESLVSIGSTDSNPV